MNRRLLILVAAALLLPIVLRFVWFFPGFVLPHTVATPDYANLKMPEPPVSTPAAVSIKPQALGTVLVDYAHANQFQMGEIQSLTAALTQRGGHFVLASDSDSLAPLLKTADSYVVISPSSAFKAEEIAAVRSFVARGGHLAVFTDATRGAVQYDFLGNPVGNLPDVNLVDPLLEPFDITANADYLYDLGTNEGNFRNVFLTSVGKSALVAGVGRVTFYGTHSLSTDTGTPLLVGGATTLSSSTDAMPVGQAQKGWSAAVLSKDGNVVAFGDFSFLAPPADTVADNQLLIDHLADFLLQPRQPSLADFPSVFRSSTVDLVVTSELQLSADMTDKISTLQTLLASTGVELRLAKSAPAQGDKLILGTFTPSDDLNDFVKPFGLNADSSTEFVTLPPFGKLGQSGTGLMLFHAASDGNTLVLLASSLDDMTKLIDTVGTGSLTGCLLQGNVAACSIGFGGGFQESLPTPELSPTPPPSG